jgi:hypothetical protein
MSMSEPNEDPTIVRLNEEIDFYATSQLKCRRNHRLLATIEVICAALIPVILTVTDPISKDQAFPRTTAALLGAAVLMVKGIRGVYQFQETWLRHKRTWVALDNERTLYLANASHYESAKRPTALLAENIASIVGGEVRDFFELQRQPTPATEPSGAPERANDSVLSGT